jgi:hypothetical protein
MWWLHDDWQWFRWSSGSCWYWTFSPNIFCCQVQEVCTSSLYKMLLKEQYIYVKSHQKGKTIKEIYNKSVIWRWCMKLVNSVWRVQVLYKWVRDVWRLPSFYVSLHMTNWCNHCLGACRLMTNKIRNGRICRNEQILY